MTMYYKFSMYMVTTVAVIAMVVTIFVSSINSGALSHNGLHVQNLVQTVLVEKFPFFTKDPKDVAIRLFEIKDDSLEEINLKSNSSETYFGFSRKKRRLLLEVGTILSDIQPKQWNDINYSEFKFANLTNQKGHDIQSTSFKVFPPGKFVILLEKPILWEWTKITNQHSGQYVVIQSN